MCYSFSFLFKVLLFFCFNVDIVHSKLTWYIKQFWSICYICWNLLINLLHLLKCSLFMHFSETYQICSRADCEKSIYLIFSSQVSNKMPRISVSFELWYLIVAHLVLDLLKNRMRPLSKITRYMVCFWRSCPCR